MLKQSKIVITDTSCFIILEKIEAAFILNQLFTFIATTPEIAKEFGSRLPDWVHIEPVKDHGILNKYIRHVDLGEATAIALAFQIHSDYLLLDDYAARKFAEKLGLSVKGTIGVLLAAKQAGVIPAIKPYIEAIQQTNFRISTQLIDNILKDADEQ